MGLWNFGSACLPYCLYRNEGGEWIALNREYKPLGFNTDKWIAYEQYPIGIKYKRDKKLREKFHAGNCKHEDWIYLYNDASNPWRSKENMSAYMERLSRLCMLEIDDGYDYGQPLGFDKIVKENRGVSRKYIDKEHYIKLHLDKYGNHCYYCGDEMTLNMGIVIGFRKNLKRPTIDHIKALARGGTDHPDNLLVCCKQYNSTKHANSFEEFRAYMQKKNGVDHYKFYGETICDA